MSRKLKRHLSPFDVSSQEGERHAGPSPAPSSSLDFSLLFIPPRSLCGGLLGCLGVVMASVSDVGESSHDHDRDDHGATEEGNVRMTVHERQV